jgi:phage replication O-like protein O
MANPQIEEGYVRIATEIQDAFCRTRIPGEERQVLDVIIRKTYGWNKCEDTISLSQFTEITGLAKQHVARSIKSLLSKKIITVTKNGDNKPQVFKLNKNHEEWRVSPKKVTSPFLVKGVTNNGDRCVTNNGDNKRQYINTITKDNYLYLNKVAITKNGDTFGAEALRLAELLYSEIITQNSKSRLAAQNTTAREKTITGWAKDIEKLIGIDQQEPSTVEEVIFFATHDDFWGPNILSGKKLREKWDTLTRKMNQKGQKHGNAKPSGIEPFSDIPVSMRGGIWD